MTIRRRWDDSGTHPGTDLLTCSSVSDWLAAANQFLDATGLHASSILIDPIIQTALPLYPQAAPDSPRPRWSGVPADVMWHPLWWLPPRLWRLSRDGQLEPTKIWALRVGLELQASDLYDVERGWIDILAEHGIDSASVADSARIRQWQGGGTDQILDVLTVEDHLTRSDVPDWSASMSGDLYPAVQDRAWALACDDLLTWIDALTGDPDAADHALLIPVLALFSVADAKPQGDVFWTWIEDRLTAGDLDALVAARQWLVEVREDTWDGVDIIQTITSSEGGQA